jgi:hypothetical protein
MGEIDFSDMSRAEQLTVLHAILKELVTESIEIREQIDGVRAAIRDIQVERP